MKTLTSWLRRAALATCLALPLFAHAGATPFFVPYDGSGNISVFEPAAGTGGWVGSIVQTPPPDVPEPLSLVSFVLYQFDAATLSLTGSFEFTDSNDLASTLFGSLTGSAFNADILSNGGQFSIDYTILGGTGLFADANGFGLAFVNYDPMGSFDNYTETGLLSFTVPEPGSLALLATGLLGLAVVRRRGQPVNLGA